MRVVAGSLRGRRISGPDNETTRPTTDKVREAVFNALGSLGVVEDARVLDLCAGSGAMGIEALSRGASHCTFVETDRAALATLRDNIDSLGISEHCTVVAGDALSRTGDKGEFDLLIADPPYGFTDWPGLLEGARASFVVLESDRSPGDLPGWDTVREKRYGRTVVTFLERQARASAPA